MAGRKGQRKQVAMPARSGIGRMWNSMRQLRTFSTADLIATAEVGTSTATGYVRVLRGAGYLVQQSERRNGQPMGHAVHRLVKDTGPVPPRESADGVFDANLADPYQMPPSKRLCKHAQALHKALREALDAFRSDWDSPGYDQRLQERMDSVAALLEQIDGHAA